MRHYPLTLAAPDLEAAVHGLVATTDEGAALLAQLEALLSGATAPRTHRAPSRRAEPLSDAQVQTAWLASGANVSAAAAAIGCARSTLRDRLARLSPAEARS